jgi:hypothetical protein
MGTDVLAHCETILGNRGGYVLKLFSVMLVFCFSLSSTTVMKSKYYNQSDDHPGYEEDADDNRVIPKKAIIDMTLSNVLGKRRCTTYA